MSSGILPSFLGALQASLAVLLTISYGVIASRFNLLKESSSRDISKTCVGLFLPALLITNVGSQLHVETAIRYVPVLVWALIYTLSSMALGWGLKRVFKFPSWTIPAISFNNTTALPLLLVQALATSGVLDDLLMDSNDTTSAAVDRAKSYFLISSIVGNSLTFAFGSRLLGDEEAPDVHHERPKKTEDEQADEQRQNDEEQANPKNSNGRTSEQEEEHVNESTSLLPDRIARSNEQLDQMVENFEESWMSKLPPWFRNTLILMASLFNAPMIGALIGGVIGLTPALHRMFFSKPAEGGIFTAWVTSSVKSIGELFAALQLVVVGSKLSGSLVKMKLGKASGTVNLVPMLTVFFIRFIMWPLISIPLIYFIATRTTLLHRDPILYFALMMLPTGPSATKLNALADISGSSEDEKMSIAKFIAVSYLVSPIICVAVVGSLRGAVAVG